MEKEDISTPNTDLSQATTPVITLLGKEEFTCSNKKKVRGKLGSRLPGYRKSGILVLLPIKG